MMKPVRRAHASDVVNYRSMCTISREKLIVPVWVRDHADWLLNLDPRWAIVRFLGPHTILMPGRSEPVRSIPPWSH